MLFGPRLAQGFGSIHPFHHQEFYHLQDYLNEVTNATMTGKLLQAIMEGLQLEVGTDTSLAKIDFLVYQNSTMESHIKDIWHYMNIFEFHFTTQQQKIKILREEDKFLMEVSMENRSQTTELWKLNFCRTWLQSFSIANITMCDGKEILQEALMGKNQMNLDKVYG